MVPVVKTAIIRNDISLQRLFQVQALINFLRKK